MNSGAPSQSPQSEVVSQGPKKTQPQRHKILVVEDEPNLCELILRVLESQNYEVCSAADGDQALRAVELAAQEKAPFSLLLTDLNLSGDLSGLETLRRIHQTTPQLPAVVSSGHGDDPVMEDYLSYGFRRALPKPYSIAQLISTVNQALESP
jgi:CheY-like chemotaxis protein